jgi:hypothetical protein
MALLLVFTRQELSHPANLLWGQPVVGYQLSQEDFRRTAKEFAKHVPERILLRFGFSHLGMEAVLPPFLLVSRKTFVFKDPEDGLNRRVRERVIEGVAHF